MKASWERIAHILMREKVSDVALAGRLNCSAQFVARVRQNLRLPPLPGTTDDLPAAPSEQDRTERDRKRAARFAELTEVVEGGHRRWLGRTSPKCGTPRWSSSATAARVSFQLTHGRDPVGHVRVECAFPRCVEGGHLSDRLIREAARTSAGTRS